MCADITRHQAKIDRLNAGGHPCPDNEKRLKRLKESLAVVRSKPAG
jgi:hypothetical protein